MRKGPWGTIPMEMASLKVKIEKLIYGGWGLCRHQGKVLLLPGVIPGEVVEAEVKKEFKDYSIASPVEILSPSPHRLSPPCPHFLQCGGCDYQHIPYPLQLAFKEEIFKEELERLGKIPPEKVRGIVPSAREYQWRIKLDLAVEGREGLKIGFYRRETKEVVDIEQCLVAHPLAEKVLEGLRLALRRHQVLVPAVKRAEITVSPDEGKAQLLLYTHVYHNKRHIDQMADELVSEHPELKDVLVKHRAVVFPRSLLGKGRTQSALQYLVDGARLLSYAGVFLQANWEVNKELIAILRDHLKEGGDTALELFSGIGNLSIPLAPLFRSWVGVERNPLAVKNANYNAHLNKIRARFLADEAVKVLEAWRKEEKGCDLLLLDPPRQGALEELKLALNLRPKRIVYVSCNPSTLARDLRLLLDNGYELEECIPLDFFPQSYHIESVSFLKLP